MEFWGLKGKVFRKKMKRRLKMQFCLIFCGSLKRRVTLSLETPDDARTFRFLPAANLPTAPLLLSFLMNRLETKVPADAGNSCQFAWSPSFLEFHS